MYQAYWGLRDVPFRNTLDARRFFRGPVHEEALARLHFLADGHWRLGLLIGPPGVGKSLLLCVFADELRRTGAQVAKIDLRASEPDETLWRLASGLGLAPSDTLTTTQLWRAISDRLAENRYQRVNTVVLFDNLDRAPGAIHEQVVRLLHTDPSPDSRLSVVAAVDPARFAALGRLLDLVDLRIELAPWTREETQEYVQHALAREGCQRKLFGPEAIARLHELSCGLPRRVNQLAELALLAAAGGEATQIDPYTIETVECELAAPLGAI